MIKPAIPVLCYHNVSDVDGHTPARFAEHLDALDDAGWRTISSLELLRVVRGEMQPPRKSVVLTFDDGHLSNWLTVVPELERRSMTGTFFALTDFITPGEPRTAVDAPVMRPMNKAFTAALRDGDCEQFINEGEVAAMFDKGMEVFSHGRRHQAAFRSLRPRGTMGDGRWTAWSVYDGFGPDWPVFDDASGYVYDGFQPVFDTGGAPRFVKRAPQARLDFCRRDFRESLERMRELNGLDEQLFCWPWGQFGEDAEAELKDVGYNGAFTLDRGPNLRGTDPFRLHRIGVSSRKTGGWIQRKLRMYGTAPAARIFLKRQRKQPEVARVLYVTDSTSLSGGSRQMLNNMASMQAMGVEPLALLHTESPLAAEVRKLGADVVEFDGFRQYVHAGRFLAKVVREREVDVVHTFHNRAYKMGVIARLLGVPCKLFINRGVSTRPNAVFFLWTAASDGVIANSRACARVLRRHLVLPSRLNVVYNAFLGQDFGAPPTRKKRGIRFIYVGNAAEDKGHAAYLQAAALLCESGCRDVEFVSVGVRESELALYDDVLTPALRERWRNTGKLPHDEVLDELRFADVICVPPNQGKESFPNTLVEGFSAGLPGIGTRAGGIPEMLRDGVNGLLCDIGDVPCLADKMRYMIDRPLERCEMGRAAHATAFTLLTPEIKGRALMRVYMGERLDGELPVEKLAAGLQPSEDPDDRCPR